jgi:hypothetical protein
MSVPSKACPRCQEPTALESPACARCGHVYRTRFSAGPDQTQLLNPPAPGAARPYDVPPLPAGAMSSRPARPGFPPAVIAGAVVAGVVVIAALAALFFFGLRASTAGIPSPASRAAIPSAPVPPPTSAPGPAPAVPAPPVAVPTALPPGVAVRSGQPAVPPGAPAAPAPAAPAEASAAPPPGYHTRTIAGGAPVLEKDPAPPRRARSGPRGAGNGLPPPVFINHPGAVVQPAPESDPPVEHTGGGRVRLAAGARLPCGHPILAARQPGTSIEAECGQHHLWTYRPATGWRYLRGPAPPAAPGPR